MKRMLVGMLSVLLSAGCTQVLDFADECKIDADCDAIASGQRCDRGFCTPKALLNKENGPCREIYGANPDDPNVKSVFMLGTLFARSGDLGSYGEKMDQAVQLAVSEINQAGGILGTQFGIISCDDGTTPETAVAVARHLADVGKVRAILGATGSGATIAAFNALNPFIAGATSPPGGGVLMVSPSATSPAITSLPDYGLLWRTVPSDAIQGSAIARFIAENQYRSVALVYRDDAYGNGLADVVREELCATALQQSMSCDDLITISSFPYPSDGADQATVYQNIALGVQVATPDAIVLISYVQDGIAFLEQLGSKVPRSKLIVTDGMRDASLIAREGAIDATLLCSLIGTAPANPSGEAFLSFSRRFNAKFEQQPGTFGANAYDAAYAVALAYAAARGRSITDVQAGNLADGLRRLSAGPPVVIGPSDFGVALGILTNTGGQITTVDIEGVSGPLDFDPDRGEAPSGIEMWRLDLRAGSIKSLNVVYNGQGAYNFDAVTQDQETLNCGTSP